ncbi:unnamed protein product [Victoria cruziana]
MLFCAHYQFWEDNNRSSQFNGSGATVKCVAILNCGYSTSAIVLETPPTWLPLISSTPHKMKYNKAVYLNKPWAAYCVPLNRKQTPPSFRDGMGSTFFSAEA